MTIGATFTTTLSTNRSFVLRPYQATDHFAVIGLLVELPSLYPGGSSWLSSRLDDVETGSARCRVAFLDGMLAGVAIETPKPAGRIKLSTFYVSPDARRIGIGNKLASTLVADWISESRPECYVTVAHTRENALLRVLGPYGFTRTAFETNRYGAGRHESVLTWLS